MASTPIYFQWQNETLLQTIYPLREMKLRDFLVFYNEIDVWAQYKSKTIDDIKDEVDTYRNNLTRNWSAAYDLTQRYKEEFIKPTAPEDYRKKYPTLDPELYRRSTLLFNTFKTYLPRVKDVRNERYFIAQRISEWEITRKWVAKKVEQHQRNLRNMPANWVHRPQREKDLAALEKDSLPMADEVLNKLYAYLSSMTKIEKRRVEMQKWRSGKEKDKFQLSQRLQKATQEAQALEGQHRKAADALERVKNPLNLAALEAYFAKEDVGPEYRAKLGDTDPAVLSKANQAHKTISSYFKTVTNPATRAFFVKGQTSQFDLQRRTCESRIAEIERNFRNMPTTWSRRPELEKELARLKNVILPMVEGELSKLSDLQAALENTGKSQADLAKKSEEAEKTFNDLDARLRAIKDEVADLEMGINLVEESAGKPEKELLLAFLIAQPITVNDIVMGKMEDYRQSLQDKDQYELLELIIQRFQKEPKRYPLWLQYMVVHFSGMRYQSAHGSWADPKDLLLSLRLKDIENELKRADNDVIDALCEEKLAIYDPQADQAQASAGQAAAGQAGPTQALPALAKAQEERWKDKIEIHVQRMRSLSPYTRRSALLNLRTDEENYAIDAMSDKDALAALEEIKDDLPEWMWKEIVRLTDLRLKEVTDKNWENLTPEEQEERTEYEYREFRQIMDDWKSKNLTGWREEHDRTNKLIVTRAVCNEVAEHIQHLRGQSPPGGLTAKPEWYRRKEGDPKLAAGPEKPILIKPKAPQDFKPGASILWLRFVFGEPNPWRIAHPLLVRGEGLLSPGLIGRSGAGRPGHNPGPNDPGSWSYTQDSRSFRRTRNSHDAKGHSIREEQWLRWIHEATVVEVAETAEGTVVLTFETALPYEDKRLSTIGVFKHHINAVRHNVGPFAFIASFIGYVPEGDVPYDDLREMLDWNKVLLKGYISEAELREYQSKAGIVGMRSLQPRRTEVSVWLEASPEMASVKQAPDEFQDVIRCYAVDPRSRQATAYEPEVVLPRGTLMKASLTNLVRVGEETYYPVTECESEPRATDLYVRKSETIDITREPAPLMVQMQKEAAPYTLVGLDAGGKPLFQPAERLLPKGAELRISSRHALLESDAGDGVIGPDVSGKTYRLILDCPGRSSVNGLFVRSDEITELEFRGETRGSG